MTKEEIISKLTSCKFWLALAAALASLAASCDAIGKMGEEPVYAAVAVVGLVCAAISAAVYAAAEAYTDAARAMTDTKQTTTTISASSTGTAANKVVAATLAPTAVATTTEKAAE